MINFLQSRCVYQSLNFFWLIFFITFINSSLATAETDKANSLPEPLTLGYALSLSENDHPDNILARTRLDAAIAEKNHVEGSGGFQTKLEGRLQWGEPVSSSFGQKNEDHFIGLSASKRLYDFGLSQAEMNSALAKVDTYQLSLQGTQSQHRIAIMRAYFNVILSDLAYARDNEKMAIAFVRFDRIKKRNELGQVAAVELLEAENTYHVARSIRYASDVSRRASRSMLANTLNVPGQLSSVLVRPELIMHKRKMPDIEQLQKAALENNYNLKALRKKVDSARHKVISARAQKKPLIDLRLQAADYSRITRQSDRYKAGITFEMPLSSSGAIDAEIAKQRSSLVEAQAELRKAEMQIQQQVLELSQQIYIVKAQRDESIILSEYRDIALDKSRGLYELDIKSDLGDSLAFFSEALYKVAKADFDLTLVWVQLDAIIGKPVSFTVASEDLLKK